MMSRLNEQLFDEYPSRSGCRRGFLLSLALTLMLLLCLCMSSCKQVQTVVQTREVQVHDTTRVLDSVYVDKYHYIQQRGDTVYVVNTVTEWRVKWMDRVQVVQQVDSIPYEVRVTEYVRKRNGYDRFTSAGFWILLALILIVIAVKIWMRLYGLKR